MVAFGSHFEGRVGLVCGQVGSRIETKSQGWFEAFGTTPGRVKLEKNMEEGEDLSVTGVDD